MISFIGAGPGAYDLITLRGANRLSQADIVIWASSLVSPELLTYAKNTARVIDSKSLTLEEIIQIYQENKNAKIARLHSGDPSIYGAIAEQIDYCLKAERDFEIVPGVSSFSASAAVLNKELTVPGISQSLILTRLGIRTKESLSNTEKLNELAKFNLTMGIFLSASRPKELQNELLKPPSAYSPQTPCAVIYRATWPDQQIRLTTLKYLAQTISEMKVKRSTLVLVGDFLNKEPQRSKLYSPDFSHRFRRAKR
jgi:precorrin-4/cobalt-precorrin-4 C11-methyltransferase